MFHVHSQTSGMSLSGILVFDHLLCPGDSVGVDSRPHTTVNEAFPQALLVPTLHVVSPRGFGSSPGSLHPAVLGALSSEFLLLA